MRVLFIAAGTSPAGVFALAPLATAARNAGHDVLVAAFAELTPTIEAVGLPSVSVVDDHTTDSIKSIDRPGGRIEFPYSPEQELPFVGSWFGRQAAVSLPGLLQLCRDWTPDVVVGGTNAYAPALLKLHLGVPHVRQTWDWLHFDGVDPYANTELAPELDAVGADRLPGPDLTLDLCPPSLLPPDHAPLQHLRWVPGNRQRTLQRWMYTRGSRQRICVTLGSFRTDMPDMFEHLCDLVSGLSQLDAEIVVAAKETAAEQLRERFPDVRSGWVPMEFLVGTCDAIVHPSGGLTALNAMSAGTPQVIVNRFDAFNDSLARLERQGSAAVLYRGSGSPEDVAAACHKLLSDPQYAHSARELAAEVRSMPVAHDAVRALEQLVLT